MKLKATSGKKPVTIIRIIKSPITAISKALDAYGKCMINFSVNYNKPFMIMEDTPKSHQMRTILSETDRHPQAVIRGITTTTTGHSSVADTAMMWPSPMRTIHEDRVCSFRDDHGVVCEKKVANKISFVVKSVCR